MTPHESHPTLGGSEPAPARRREWAAAVALLVAGGVAVFLLPRAGIAPWQRHGLDMVNAVRAQRVAFDREETGPEPLVRWLQEQSAPVLPTLPDALAAAKAIGGRTWERRGLRFALLSFEVEGAKTAHLVSTWQGGLKGAPALGHLSFTHAGTWNLASWSEGGLACLLVTDAGEDEMRKLLAATQGAGAPSPRVASTGRGRPYSLP